MTIPIFCSSECVVPTVVVTAENEVPLWSVEDVSRWVQQAGFQDFCDSFTDLRVDGDMLLQLTEQEIKDDIGLTNGILRKRFMRDLKELKKSADYTSCDGGLMANFLNKISPEFKVYTYNLILKELSLDFMQRLTTVDLDDMLKDSGMESSIHRHKIIEAVMNMDEDNSTLSDSAYSEPGNDVFISYSKHGGAELASLIKIQLEMRDREMSIFADCHDHSEVVSDKILSKITDSRYYLLVLQPGGLDTCMRHTSRYRLHIELVTALRSGAKIIPVTVDFTWPSPEMIPEDIRAITSFNGVRWIHDYQDACIDKIERFIKGESSRVSSPFNLRRDSGRSTPISSPMIYHKALKNKAISFENILTTQST